MITINDILNKVNDYLAHYTTGSAGLDQKIRAIDSACDFYKLRITLPSDKRTTTIYYDGDSRFYELPDDFLAPLLLRYENENLNTQENEFVYVDYNEISRNFATSTSRKLWSWTIKNGIQYLVIKSQPIGGSTIIDTCDNLNNFTTENDANLLSLDFVLKKEGEASLSFNIQKTPTSLGSIKKTFQHYNDWSDKFSELGEFRCWVYLPTINISSIDFVVFNSNSDFWKIVSTKQADGSPFVVGWNKILWRIENGFQVGQFNSSSISGFRIDFVENQQFTTTNNFRIDDIRYINPDRLELTYITTIKGTDGSGNPIKKFTDISDIPSFYNFAPSLSNLIALRAATYLAPQILKDVNYVALFKAEEKEILSQLGKLYPKETSVNYGKVRFQR